MTLEQSEGYLIALKDVKTVIEQKIQECEYALGECYTALQASSENLEDLG